MREDPYKEPEVDVAEVDTDIVCLSSSHLEVVWSQAETDGQSPSSKAIQTQPRPDQGEWTPDAQDLTVFDHVPDGQSPFPHFFPHFSLLISRALLEGGCGQSVYADSGMSSRSST
jgi:hypothetical protein